MALAIWPEELPQRPLQSGFSRGVGDGRASSAMAQGPGKTRLRYTATVKPVPCTIQLTADQYFRLDRFWEEDTKGGTQPFMIIDPMAHGQPALLEDGSPWILEDGTPVLISAWWVVMFGQSQGDAPTATPLSGDLYRASFLLNVMP
jgi:hypothetical protein